MSKMRLEICPYLIPFQSYKQFIYPLHWDKPQVSKNTQAFARICNHQHEFYIKT